MTNKKATLAQIDKIFAVHSGDEIGTIILKLIDAGLSSVEVIKTINLKLGIGLRAAKEQFYLTVHKDRLNKFYASYPIKDKVFINQIAQGVKNIEEGQDWFSQLENQDQLEMLKLIHDMAMQAGAVKADIYVAIDDAELKPTCAPCALLDNLLRKGRFTVQLPKILKLPANEYEKVFILLINLLKIADKRRRKEVCQGDCSHWWHQDLSDKRVVKEILNGKA